MPLFQKGQSGNIQGRPKGSKDHRWASVGFWFEELKKDWGKLKPSVRAKLSIELMKMVSHKLKQLPSDPNESAMNVADMMGQLKEIESKIQTKPDSVTPKAPPVEPV